MAYSNNDELNHIIGQSVNRLGTAEGSIVLPKQHGQMRVPPVTNVQLLSTKTAGSEDPNVNVGIGTTFTVGWNDVITQENVVDHYNIYAVNPANNQVYLSTLAFRSPALVNVPLLNGTLVKIIIQTVFASGMSTPLALCPSVTGTCGKLRVNIQP